jgi:hypothetical protein
MESTAHGAAPHPRPRGQTDEQGGRPPLVTPALYPKQGCMFCFSFLLAVCRCDGHEPAKVIPVADYLRVRVRPWPWYLLSAAIFAIGGRAVCRCDGHEPAKVILRVRVRPWPWYLLSAAIFAIGGRSRLASAMPNTTRGRWPGTGAGILCGSWAALPPAEHVHGKSNLHFFWKCQVLAYRGEARTWSFGS